MALCKSTGEEVKWSHHKISSTDSTLIPTLHTFIVDPGSEGANISKQVYCDPLGLLFFESVNYFSKNHFRRTEGRKYESAKSDFVFVCSFVQSTYKLHMLLCYDRNAVPFTETQVEAIRAGMQPGLTMVGASPRSAQN